MSRNRKYYAHNMPVLVTSRTETGLPFVPTLVMNAILWSVLARARTLYAVKVCHFVFMSNHFHMLLVVDDPEDVSKFVGYVKTESAHAVNKMLGRRQRTIWVKGYDSPAVLSADDILRYIDYIYVNPAKAHLVSSIEHYPGVSSWEMFCSGKHEVTHKHLSRAAVPELYFTALSVNEQRKMVEHLLSDRVAGDAETFVLEPYAWMDCFERYRDEYSEEDIKEKIKASVAAQEQLLCEQRKRAKRDVIGATALRRQDMQKEYTPRVYGRKMICICRAVEVRKRFIAHYRALCEKAAEVYQRWKRGEQRSRIPPGLLAPQMPVLAVDSTAVT